jgi:hypothetical protein
MSERSGGRAKPHVRVNFPWDQTYDDRQNCLEKEVAKVTGQDTSEHPGASFVS